jgi:muramidase (phage lysozyme)
MITANAKAFLDMIAYSEIGAKLLAVSDNGYNVIVGSTPSKPILFDSYAKHPNKLIKLSPTLSSTAAGRYQLLSRYYDAYKVSMKLPDFSPTSQDQIALRQIGECMALGDVNSGNFESAVNKCSRIWASLPGAKYGQHVNNMGDLKKAYLAAGGALNQ